MINKKRSLSVYIHIPFCVRKCLYCDFLSFPAGEELRERYLRALCGEMVSQSVFYKDSKVRTVFLGGGTPSLLSGEQISRILACLRAHYDLAADAEITMEMNPGTLTRENLSCWRDAGVNRVSLGLQSADNRELSALGRIHTWETFLRSYDLCRRLGFANINVDLMSALPGQGLRSWEKTLRLVTDLEPEHISAYSLMIEEGTPFYERYGDGQKGKDGFLPLPDEETEFAMYRLTREFLESKGYRRYEISNYARPGKECAHNSTYWTRGEYAGFGLGAASMIGNARWVNLRDMDAYMSAPPDRKKTQFHRLTVKEQMEETMFLGLRMIQGVSGAAFREAYGVSVETVYGDALRKHIADGLLEYDGDVRLTDAGIDVSNYVLADFLL